MAWRRPFPAGSIGVIVGLDLIGDALIKLPFLRALRAAYPDAAITWVTSQGATAYNGPLRPLTRHLIDHVAEQPAWLLPGAEDAAPRFDLWIDTRNRWRTTLAARRVPHGLFLAPAARFLLSDRRPGLLAPRPAHLVDRLLQLVRLAAGHVPPVLAGLPVPDRALAAARSTLPPGSRYVGLAPGAGNPIKIWPRAGFEHVAAAIAASGRTPVFLLGPQEREWLDPLRAAVPQSLFPLQSDVWGGPPALEHTLAVATLLDLAVANDSGTGHMLAAVDCPLISLFGPTSAAKLAPRVTRGQVIDARTFGSRSMDAIPWRTVADAVVNWPGTPPSPAPPRA